MEFRHGIHFSNQSFLRTFNNYAAKPIQSKTLLSLHHMTFDIFKSIKMNLDLLYIANPEAAQFPFDEESRNQKREELYSDLVVRAQRLPKTDTALGKDLERWRESRSNRLKVRKQIGPIPAENPIDKQQLYKNSCNKVLHDLLQYFPQMREGMGKALWYNINYREMSFYDLTYLYNKLASVADQIRIVQGMPCREIDNNFSYGVSSTPL